MAFPTSEAAAPPITAVPSSSSPTEPESAAAATADSAATGAAIPTELKSEAWPYPLKLPSFPLDFNLLRNPKLSIFHDSGGHPLVRYYWPSSTARAAASSTREERPTHSVRARAVVVLVHDQGTHTVFDWLKNAPLMCKSRHTPIGALKEPAGIISRLSSTDRNVTPEHLAAPPPLDIGLNCSEVSASTRTALAETDRSAGKAENSSSDGNTRGRDGEAALKGEKEDAVGVAAEAAAATLTAATAATEGVASLLPAEPLFRDLPQKPLHAVRTACYEGSWVELFNASGFDVYAVDLLQHGLSALVDRQQQRQRRRRWRHQKKDREAAADDRDTKTEDDEDTPFSFDLLAESLCCMLEDVSRFSTLPIFLLGQGTGATIATRAAELLAKKGKLGKPHMPRHATETGAHATDDLTVTEELCVDPIAVSSEEVATSPLLAGIRHLGKETILPVQHVAVHSRPIPLAGLMLLSPVLQLRESVALEQIMTTKAASANREKRGHLKHDEQRYKTADGLAEERRFSGESYISEVEHSTSAEEEEEEKGGKRKEKGSTWNVLSWLLGRSAEEGRALSAADQCGVRLRRRRHPHAHQHPLLPPLNIEEEQELEEEKEFGALYDKLYFHDRLTIKTLLPCTQLVELRKGIARTLTDARWLLIPIERDSRQLITAATWQEQYQRWKKTIARRVRERNLPDGLSSEQLLRQQSGLSFSSEEHPLEGDQGSVDLAPWLQPDTPAVTAADATSVGAGGFTQQTGAAKAHEAGSLLQKSKQEEEDEVQQGSDATEAEMRRRRQLKRMQMAFYLKVLVVQGMTAPQEIVYQCCGSHARIKALPADREVECFAEASDVQGVVSFYRSLGGRANVARRILVQHGQLPPPQRKKRSSRGLWISQCCSTVGDDDSAATALAAVAAAEAAQTDNLVLLDVGSEEHRMDDDSDWEDEGEEAVGKEEDVDDSEESEGEYVYERSAAAEHERFDSSEVAGHDASSTASAGVPFSSAQAQAHPPPTWMLPPATTGASGLLRVGGEGGGEGSAAAATAEEWLGSDVPSNAAIEARYYALEEERKRLDESLRQLDVDVLSRAEAGAEEEAAARKELFPAALRRDSSVYKSVYERDLQRYGTVVRLPDRPVTLGQTNVTAADLCQRLLLKQCDCTFGDKPVLFSALAGAEESFSADKEGAAGPRLEHLKWVKEYPVSWQGCSGGLLLPYACMQAPCEGSARVRIVENIKAPVQVVEKIFMHEATDALKATIAEIKARERQQKGGIAATATKSLTGEEPYLLDKKPGARPVAAQVASRKSRKLRLRDVRFWRRVGAIVVNGKGKQVLLEEVEKLRVKFPREYVNLFLYGATCEAAAALAGAAASVDAMQHRQVTMWLLPEVHHNALCQGDKGNKVGKKILDNWLLPALEDLQRSETLWHGSQVRSQLRRQLSIPGGLPLRNV